MNMSLLKAGTDVYADVLRAVNESAGGGAGGKGAAVQAWMGEGNAAGHGGRKGVTDRFINSFWYLNAMGKAGACGPAIQHDHGWGTRSDVYVSILIWCRVVSSWAQQRSARSGSYGRH
eukprot:SAG22_NODE_477_length_9978_cov_2.807268_4_plen_118_part_00